MKKAVKPEKDGSYGACRNPRLIGGETTKSSSFLVGALGGKTLPIPSSSAFDRCHISFELHHLTLIRGIVSGTSS
jgi:hypothetical protein